MRTYYYVMTSGFKPTIKVNTKKFLIQYSQSQIKAIGSVKANSSGEARRKAAIEILLAQ